MAAFKAELSAGTRKRPLSPEEGNKDGSTEWDTQWKNKRGKRTM